MFTVCMAKGKPHDHENILQYVRKMHFAFLYLAHPSKVAESGVLYIGRCLEGHACG